MAARVGAYGATASAGTVLTTTATPATWSARPAPVMSQKRASMPHRRASSISGPAFCALRAVTVPARGGATQFSNQYRAYETLPEPLRTRLDGRSIRHVVTGLSPDDAGTETEAWHPVFRPHPRTGRTALYLSTAARCAEVGGMDTEESAATVRELIEHSTRPDNVLDHRWAPGDVVIWDNACVLHRADHAGVVGDRVMHRGMVREHVRPRAAR